jgi:oxygen-independent coproporphyrinogen-3 oxidase
MILDENTLPLGRAYSPTKQQMLIREMILQLKKGWLDLSYFKEKFHTNILEQWRDVWEGYANEGYAVLPESDVAPGSQIRLTIEGLLRVDGLLPAFFEPQFRNVRYT